MKFNKWSVVPTADNRGVSMKVFGCSTEICVRELGGEIIIRAYAPASDTPVAEFRLFDAGDDND